MKKNIKWVTGRPVDIDAKNCWRRGRVHNWNPIQFRWANHQWKCCRDCNAKRRTYHISCHVACWGGPG